MDQQRSSLCVSIHNVEFAKDFNYFITVQINADGEKVSLKIFVNFFNDFSREELIFPHVSQIQSSQQTYLYCLYQISSLTLTIFFMF